MTDQTQRQAADKYGTVTFDDISYTLTQQAYCDNVGTDGGVAYYAHARRSDNWDSTDRYLVTWETTAEWDRHQSADCSDHMDGQQWCSYCEDESNACDWSNPVTVELID